MRHFPISSWADYVRDTIDPSAKRAMRRHLEDGCPRCSGLVTSLERVAKTAEADRRFSAPDYAVRSAKAFFGLQDPARRRRRRKIGLALSFDSALAPAAIGARGHRDTTRQLLFESDEYALDVRVDYPADDSMAVVVGQLLKRLGEPVPYARAYLLNAGEVATAAFTGEMGNFYMESDRKMPIELWLDLEGNRRIAVTLDPGGEAPAKSDAGSPA